MRTHLLRFTLPGLLLLCISASDLLSQTFTEQTAILLTGSGYSASDWGDYDSDGDLDLVIAGSSTTEIYKNNGNGTFTEMTDPDFALPAVYNGSVKWGDYDNDGRLDILISGSNLTRVYRNIVDTAFINQTGIILQNIYEGCADWGDYDNDGFLDICLTGYDESWNPFSMIYRNNRNNTFSAQYDIILLGIGESSLAWGDYDNDGDLDLLMAGYSYTSGLISRIYRNDGGGSFSDINAGLLGILRGMIAWGDYDNDGDLDILMTGYNWNTSPNHISRIYRNDAGVFTDISAVLTGGEYASAAWGDFDNDGDLDVLLTGRDASSTYYTKVYRNDAGSFSDISAGLTGVYCGSGVWGDYDKDGDLDIVLTGVSSSENISKIYKNNNFTLNTVPAAPTGLQATVAPQSVTLSWNKSTDTQTPQNGLSYNIRIGTTSGGINKRSPMSIVPGGFRRIAEKGAIQSNSWKIKGLTVGTYYWSVQATDNAFAGSAFATEGTFSVVFSNSVAPVTDQALIPGQNGTVLTVTESSTPTSRQWKYSTTKGGPYSQSISGATATTYTPNFGTTGTYYVVCESSYGGLTYTSNEVKVIVSNFAEQTGISLTGVKNSSVRWGDYDNDGDLDILLTGESGSGYISKIYRNDAGVFTDISAGLTGVYASSVDWGDYDNDGDLDILITGYSGSGYISKIYRNDTGVFTDINAGLTGVNDGSATFEDFDNDGDLDILLTGYYYNSGSFYVTELYRNDAGVFTKIDSGLPGGSMSNVSWGDYDNDGDQDILILGYNNSDGYFTRIYRNDAGVFTNINTGFYGYYRPKTSWGDYDSDGDLDILITGRDGSKIYKNDAGIFTDITAGLPDIDDGSAAWGDYDNDGDLDVFMSGRSTLGLNAKIFRNDNGIFTEIITPFQGVSNSSVSWGDYDNDGDLDLLLTGSSIAGPITKVFKNNASPANAVPTAPTGLQTTVGSNKVTFTWNKSTDTKTSQNSLTYNLYIGTAAGTVNKKSPMAAVPGGYRRIVARGIQTSSWTINKLAAGTYYWSVQALDNNFAGSAFATAGTFTIAFSNSVAPVAEQVLLPNQSGTVLTVTESSAPTSRQWKYSTVSGGPYDQTITAATGTTYTPVFASFGTYYVVCVSTKDAVDYTTNEVKISVPAFTEQTGILLPGISNYNSSNFVVWGDYDNDSDLDMLLTGWSSTYGRISRIYRNDAGVFTDISAGLFGFESSSAAWGDYDNDGDLDVCISGYYYDLDWKYGSFIYRNDAGVFTDISAGLIGVGEGSVAWGDYDNDGDLDLLMGGWTGSGYVIKIYRNDAGIFTDINAELVNTSGIYLSWGDYDNDGDLDILAAGSTSRIYRNDNGVFANINAGISGAWDGSGEWGDYDSDGDLDILLSGSNTFKIYKNDAGIFTDIEAGLIGIEYSSAVWGDFDNDGDLDILMSGRNSTYGAISKILKNDSGVFTDINANITGTTECTTAWGDYDNDGDLDFIIAGNNITKVYKNNSITANTVPTPPTNLQASLGANKVTLSWNKSTDTKTAQNALTYNLYIGTTAGSVNKKSPMAAVPGGYRRIVRRGTQTNAWTIKKLTAGTYYWSVQAIDNNFAGSPFATEGSFVIAFSNSIAPVADQTLSLNENGTVLTVTESSTPTSRQWKYSTISGGPYDQTITGATGTTYTPNFSAFGTYYVVCVSTKDAIAYTTNEVKISVPAFAEQSGLNIPAVDGCSLLWGDYDNDGDLDIFVSGYSNSDRIARIYRNDLGVYNDISAGLTAVRSSSASWSDYDNDGDLDLLVTGDAGSSNYISKIYRNDAGTFTDIAAGLPGVYNGSSDWRDYDNDGDLDILLTGYTGSASISRVYRNDAGVFTDINAGLPGVSQGSSVWGDYDNDGDPDILLTGSYISSVYKNDNGVFTDINAGLPGLGFGSASWADYDSDGDLDILITGYTGQRTAKIYKNDAGVFTDISATLAAVEGGTSAWGDFDNDGDLDIIITGYEGSSNYTTKYYKNDSGAFTEVTDVLTGYSFTGVNNSSVVPGDYDNDGDLDILLAGYNNTIGRILKLYKNNTSPANAVPSAPTNLQASLGANKVTFSWNKSTDSKTAQDALTYNLYIGTTAGSVNRKSPMAALPGGYRRIVQRGTQTNSWTIKRLVAGKYYWSVQAIDNNFAGSQFATEGTFTVAFSNSIAPVADQILQPGQSGSVLTVTESSTPTSRQWKYSTTSGGPYDQTIAGATGTTYTPNFATFGTYYVVCISTKDAIAYTTNEVKISVPAFAEQTSITLPAVDNGSVMWGDYDSDGDLDILLTGYSNSSGTISRIYRNDLGVYTDINAGLTGVYQSSAAWGDYDNDGDLDLLLTGNDGSSNYLSKIYRNDAGIFTDIAAGLTGVYDGSSDWRDYDNDGDLDILLTGNTGSSAISKIYRNDAGIFTDINAGLIPVSNSSVGWGDYDNDGDPDILLTGNNNSKIYRNDNGIFTDIIAGLTGVYYSSCAWGDYDSDGDLDILLTGYSGNTGTRISKVYNNKAGVFRDTVPDLTGVDDGLAAWGDYDNDGDLDIIISGYILSSPYYISKFYRNDSGTFTDITGVLTGYSVTGVSSSSAAFGDYDNDGALDILLAGYNNQAGRVSKVYRNNTSTSNAPPSAPTNLVPGLGANKVTLSWNESTDTKTAQKGLTYNLYIGTTAGSVNRKSPMAAVPGGYRRIVQRGIQNNIWTINRLSAGTYYWSVQAIDNCFAGSAFATEGTFTVAFSNSIAPAADQTLQLNQSGSVLTVTESSAPTSRQWKYSTTSGGPYDQTIAGATGTTYTPNFAAFGTYYVVCVSTKDAVAYTTNEVKISVPAFAEQTGIVLPGLRYCSMVWGDYDSDGDLDILMTGLSPSDNVTRIYRNDLGVFTDINAGLQNAYRSSAAWGDYDNDGDLDILLTGYYWNNLSSVYVYISKIYRNDAGVFTDINAGLTGVRDGAIGWGDYDNDGDLDILLTGYDGSVNVSKIYRNDTGVFTDINAGLTGVNYSSVEWGDYDNDSDLDILLTGNGYSRIYRNDNGTFTDINAGLSGVSDGFAAWGDYDSDGDLDVLVSGDNSSKIYKNDAGAFADIDAGLIRLFNSYVVWGDIDSDGDLDIILNGYDQANSLYVTKLYSNSSGTFSDITNASTGYSFAAVYQSSIAVGDYDKDGDLDVLIAGNSTSGYVTKVYKNNSTTANVVPTAPSNLVAIPGSNKVTLTWNKSTDTKTPQDGLSYNLYIGTTAGSVNRRSPMSAVPGGYRRIVQRGDAHTNTWTVRRLSVGTYYWSIQAIDNNFAGSSFATEGSFVVAYSNSIAPVTDQTLLINQSGSALTVTESSAPASRQWKYSTVSGGPYDQTITGATGTTYTPVFAAFGTYYVVCVSTKDAVEYTSNEVKINVPVFTEQTGISLPGLSNTSSNFVAWGDYDNDGDLDILLTGYSNSAGGRITRIYRNDSGVFTDITAGLAGFENASAAWGDYDNDGDLDILLTGYYYDSGWQYAAYIYKNDAGVFTDISAGSITGVSDGAVAWSDFDNDGDLDILLAGHDGTEWRSKIFQNTAGVFTDINAGIPAITTASVDWGDYDNDGDKDILLNGRIFKNDAGVFTNINAGLPNVQYGSLAWGDYDNDGDLDALMTGNGYSMICKNNGDNTFSQLPNIASQGVSNTAAAWGDYDNDGDLDILLTGSGISRVFRNNGDDTFSEAPGVNLTGINGGSVAWGDYDNDGDLDILLAGNQLTKVYRNNMNVANTIPSAPTTLLASAVSIDSVRFTWNKATDTQTAQNALSYNIRIGTAPGGSSIVGPMASVSTGYRRIPARGNADLKNNGYYIKNLAAGRYYWSVQTIDNGFAGSSWATEGQFVLLAAPVANTATNIQQTSFTANWTASTGATGYRIDVATDTTFTTILTGYNNRDAGNVTSTSITGLTSSTAYFYRIRAYSAAGVSIVNSNTIKTITLGVPAAPVAAAATNVVQTSFTANWSSSLYTSGYYLDVSTSNTFSSFVTGYNNKDVGNVTSSSVTGMTANTVYYYRVRAYNSYGTSINSGTITVTTLMNPPPVPAGLAASSCNDLVTLTWSTITEPNFLRYIIYGGTSTGPTTKIDSSAAIVDVTKTLSGLTNGMTYYFRVTAVNTAGMESSYSNQVSVVVKKGVVPRVKTKWNNVLICYNIGDSIASWQWYKNAAAISGATKQYYVTNKQAGSYYVQSTDKNGCRNNSNPANITGTKSASVWPNPASSNVSVSISSEDYGKTVIRFYNSNGVRVLEYQTEKLDFKLDSEIPLNGLQSGIYTIEVWVNNEFIDYSRIVIIN